MSGRPGFLAGGGTRHIRRPGPAPDPYSIDQTGRPSPLNCTSRLESAKVPPRGSGDGGVDGTGPEDEVGAGLRVLDRTGKGVVESMGVWAKVSSHNSGLSPPWKGQGLGRFHPGRTPPLSPRRGPTPFSTSPEATPVPVRDTVLRGVSLIPQHPLWDRDTVLPFDSVPHGSRGTVLTRPGPRTRNRR